MYASPPQPLFLELPEPGNRTLISPPPSPPPEWSPVKEPKLKPTVHDVEPEIINGETVLLKETANTPRITFTITWHGAVRLIIKSLNIVNMFGCKFLLFVRWHRFWKGRHCFNHNATFKRRFFCTTGIYTNFYNGDFCFNLHLLSPPLFHFASRFNGACHKHAKSTSGIDLSNLQQFLELVWNVFFCFPCKVCII